MVLQRDRTNTIWGWAAPGTRVKVTIQGHESRTVADQQGKWSARFTPPPVGGPYTLTIDGPKRIELQDVLVGDVWICSGQSNMEFGIGNVNNAEREIAGARYPGIRICMLPHQISFQPQPVDAATWKVCNPTTIAEGGWNGFSAVGYFFGRELNQRLHVPIGLVGTYWGGTIAESWTSREGLKSMPDFKSALEKTAAPKTISTLPYMDQLNNWVAANDPGSKPGVGWEGTDFHDTDWKEVVMPVDFDAIGLDKFDGTVWYRREIDIPDAVAAADATLSLGPIDDDDWTFVNGKLVGATQMYNAERKYALPIGTLKPGRNVIAVRVLDTGGAGGFTGKSDALYLESADHHQISLSGTWKYQVGVDLTKATALPQTLNDNPNVVTVLYNGMIQPLVPLAVKGAIWYQGESNAGRAYQYRKLLPTMIGDWRHKFGQGDFPFFIVQLANFMAAPTKPTDDAWAELREAQTMTADHVKNAGMALAIDIGDAVDIHPKDKQTVGMRLALSALKIAYGQDVVFSGPTYRSMRREKGGIQIKFDHADGGIQTHGGPVTGFAIAGADHKFVWALAEIKDGGVYVHSDLVPNPVAVRYAWAANPAASLYNGSDLPAVPFRTDTWTGVTVGAK